MVRIVSQDGVVKKWRGISCFGGSPLRLVGGRKFGREDSSATWPATSISHEDGDVLFNTTTFPRSSAAGFVGADPWRQQIQEEKEVLDTAALFDDERQERRVRSWANETQHENDDEEEEEEGGKAADVQEDGVGIDSLSDLALLKVFEGMASYDLSSVSLVCKRWCDLADQTRTHLKLQIGNMAEMGHRQYHHPDDLLSRLLTRWPSLTSVEINCVQEPLRTPGRYRSRLDFGNQTMSLVASNCGARLKELILIECLHIDATSIASCLRQCKSIERLHIERLNLRGCFHGAGAFACSCSIENDLIDAISGLNTLTNLWIEGCTGQITSGQLTRILAAPALESLALDVKMWPWPEIVMLEQGAAGFGDAPGPNVVFPKGNKMRELTWISLHPMYYPNFVTLTLSCTKLETLNLSCCILEAGIMAVVLRELCKGLLALRLINCSFGGHSLLPFPEVKCPKLSELQIVGTSGAADVEDIMSSCKALGRLVVQEPEIIMFQQRQGRWGCGFGGALSRLASRARRACRVRRNIPTWAF